MLLTLDGSLRLPSAQERETLLGFDGGYTEASLPNKVSRDMGFSLRCSGLGSGFHDYSILLDELYHEGLNIPLELFSWTSGEMTLRLRNTNLGKLMAPQ